MSSRIFSKPKSLLFKNASCVVTLIPFPEAQQVQNLDLDLGVQRNCDVLISDGVITQIGKNLGTADEVIDARGLVLMPGLVDAHTHSVYGGSRAKETVQKAKGVSYESIAAQGGGIPASMKMTRALSEEELSEIFVRNAQQSLQRGVVLLESKTGYGLNPKEEIKMLAAMTQAYTDESLPYLSPTFLGPHAASPDYPSLESYIQALIESLPEIKKAAGSHERILPLAADIFIERNYFTKEHGEKWLGACLEHGLNIHIHADEFSRSGGCEVAIALSQRTNQTASSARRILSVDHCQYATEADLSTLARLGVVAVALPATSFFSNIPFIDGNKWRSSGIDVAIASDFNPGSAPLNNLWFSAYLALTRCKMSLQEVYKGITLNGARALGAEKMGFGAIIPGSCARIVAFSGTEPEDLVASPIGDHVRYVVH